MRLVRALKQLSAEEWRFIGLVAAFDVLLLMAVELIGQLFGAGPNDGLTLWCGIVALCCVNGLMMIHWTRVKRLEDTGGPWLGDPTLGGR